MDTKDSIDLARAERARLILEDPLVVEALADIRAELLAAWQASPARDTEGREHLFRFFKVAEKFELALKIHMETGALVSAHLRAEEERKSALTRAKEFLRG
ncbi:hypothetical protein [Achromobacter xylosoxidans]|uniref:Uncharacterized protein n=1 Tax=Alcaligenes xylosoxydans xylosoxydans TaxID=85698 RepID=A0A1R1JSJ9_ALCXX|nr:hypothetical protein [Achromobacter xylosoxidans]OMG85400.1 hypothetical protein BIZ92_27015 [Achromobacter xylosoxidans]